MSESKSAFGSDHANVRRAQGDAATICAAISKLCHSNELDIQWYPQEMRSGVGINNRGFPVVRIYLEIQGAKLSERKGKA